jgi:DNA-binding NtrC family response regulator
MNILVVDDEKSLRLALADELAENGYDVDSASCGEDAQALLEKKYFDLVISDVVMKSISGMDLLKHIKATSPKTELILMTAYGTIDAAVDAVKAGALDYICKPFELERLMRFVRSMKETIQLRHENEALKLKLYDRFSFHNIIGQSASMQQLFNLLETICDTDATVIIQGETGTGKELVGEAIHFNSSRKNKAFIPVSCAALSKELLESELFGHEHGAFTGATKQKKGRFELAHEGTLFLDEIDDIPLEVQVKLLRAIQSGKFERVGGETPIQVDVRIVGTTKQNLLDLVEQGTFRRDLYYRLNVINVVLPPLRERKEDIPLLVNHFLKVYSPNQSIELSPEIMDILLKYDWDGNVRELQHAVQRLVLLRKNGSISTDMLPGKILNYTSQAYQFELGKISLPAYLDDIELRILQRALEQTKGGKTEAARLLGVPLPTFKSKLARFNQRS